jgi:hypothetical protein
MAAVGIPRRFAVLNILQAISPRLATNSLPISGEEVLEEECEEEKEDSFVKEERVRVRRRQEETPEAAKGMASRRLICSAMASLILQAVSPGALCIDTG